PSGDRGGAAGGWGGVLGAVRRGRGGLSEPSGLTGVMGAGVQGLGEAPWLDLDTPAETNGWWARGAPEPPVNQSNGSQPEDSHTLVVDREDGGSGFTPIGAAATPAASRSSGAGCSARGCSSWRWSSRSAWGSGPAAG